MNMRDMGGRQSLGASISDDLDSMSMEPTLDITGTYLTQTHRAQTMTRNIADNTNNIQI